MPISKRSAKYWQKRFEQLEDAQNNKGIEYFHDLERIYSKAISETEKDIAKWYNRYAREEGITLADAKKELSKGELKEFRMSVQEYIEKGQSLLDPSWKKELERASTKFHVTRLEALKLQMQQNVEYLMGNEADGIDKLMRDIFTDSYYHSAYEIQKGLGIGWDLMKLDNKVIDKAMSNPWTADGTNFSERIWGKYRPELVKKLHDGLTLNLIQGKRADKLIDDITKQFNVKRHQAENLVQTEKAYFQSLAQKDSFKEMNVKEYEIVATLDTKTSDICREMDGKVFKLDDFAPGATAPPFHNRCRTATAPFFDDEFEEDVRRAARDEDGKYYTVPANMKYQDWYDKFVGSGSKEGLKEAVIDTFKIIENPIDFTTMTNEEVNDWVDNYYNVTNSELSLTEEELKVLDDYGEGSYSIINGVERYEEGSDGWNRLLRNYGNDVSRFEKAKEQSKELSKALSKFNLDDDIVVHRVIRDPSYLTDDVSIDGLKKLKGEVITEKGFTSTSLSYQSKFEGGSKNAVHMEMVLPKGTKGAYIDKYVAKNEYEFLLDKNTKYKVLDVGERTVKVTKYDLKNRQWIEVDKPERYMKVQVIPGKKTVKTPNSLNTKNVNDKIKVDKISKAKDFNELKDYIKNKYDVTIDKGIEKLNFNTVRSSLEGVESVIDEIPDVGKSLNKMIVDKSGVMSCTGEEIAFNPKYFSDSETLEKLCKKYSDNGFWIKNVSPASIGAHETAHGVEWLMIEISDNYFHNFEKIEAWNKCTEAKAIVSQACKNIKKTAYGKGKKNDELINAISRYAGTSKSETMAEAFADVYANGENANPLSIEIKKLTLEKIKKYKGKV